MAGLGQGPGAQVGIGGAVFLRLDDFAAVGLALEGWAASAVVTEEGRADVDLLLIRLDGCLPARSGGAVRLDVCAAAALGRLQAEASGYSESSGGAAALLRVGARGRVSYSFFERLELVVSGGGGFNLLRPRFVVVDDAAVSKAVYQAPLGALDLSLGLGVRLF